jgi:hypothetical protein
MNSSQSAPGPTGSYAIVTFGFAVRNAAIHVPWAARCALEPAPISAPVSPVDEPESPPQPAKTSAYAMGARPQTHLAGLHQSWSPLELLEAAFAYGDTSM